MFWWGECSFMFRMEKMRGSDISFAVQLANKLDWHMTPEDYDFALKLEPEGCFTLFSGSELAGISTCISFGRIGWFGNLIVNETDRRKGVGTYLVKHSIKYLESLGAGTIGLYTYPDLVPYYGRFGFKADVEFIVLQGRINNSSLSTRPQLQMAKENNIPAIIDFDKQFFGASRKKLLERILSDTHNLCYTAVQNGNLVGYCATKVCKVTSEIGPLICRPNHEEIAIDLLKAVLSKLKKRDVFVCVPSEEAGFLEVLNKKGLQESFRVIRMFLGPFIAKNCRYIAESLERG